MSNQKLTDKKLTDLKYMNSKMADVLTPIIFVGAALVIWQFVSMSGIVPNYMLPSPTQVVSALVSDFPLLMQHSRATLTEAGLGLVFGVALGFTAAALMDTFPTRPVSDPGDHTDDPAGRYSASFDPVVLLRDRTQGRAGGTGLLFPAGGGTA